MLAVCQPIGRVLMPPDATAPRTRSGSGAQSMPLGRVSAAGGGDLLLGPLRGLLQDRAELGGLLPLWDVQQARQPVLGELKTRLHAINARMWEIQDALRECEAAQRFDDHFIQLARGVYATNGERVQVKNEINRVAGSALVEEKQYQGE